MLPFDRDTATFFREMRAHDQADVVEQFRSLPAAGQYRLLYALTARYVRPGSSVLDWGGGRGHFSYYLLRHGFRVTCYSLEDPPELFSTLSPEERGRLTFLRGADPVTVPCPTASFDAVFSVGVLEHVRETGGTEEASLAELHRLLLPGGHLIVYHFPNRLSWIEALSRLVYGRRYRDIAESVKFHKRLFSWADVTRLSGGAGFSLVASGAYGFLPRNSFNRLPTVLRYSEGLASTANVLDLILERAFLPIVQNSYFVARAVGA